MTATLKQYQKFIDVIKKDLGIEDVAVHFIFRKPAKYSGGNARIKNGVYVVTINKDNDHKNNLYVIMHELRHIYQYKNNWLTYILKKDDNQKKPQWVRIWKGVEYTKRLSARKAVLGYRINEYQNQPWEKDANTYADKVDELFPDGKIVVKQHTNKRTLVGSIGKTQFYKVKNLN